MHRSTYCSLNVQVFQSTPNVSCSFHSEFWVTKEWMCVTYNGVSIRFIAYQWCGVRCIIRQPIRGKCDRRDWLFGVLTHFTLIPRCKGLKISYHMSAGVIVSVCDCDSAVSRSIYITPIRSNCSSIVWTFSESECDSTEWVHHTCVLHWYVNEHRTHWNGREQTNSPLKSSLCTETVFRCECMSNKITIFRGFILYRRFWVTFWTY